MLGGSQEHQGSKQRGQGRANQTTCPWRLKPSATTRPETDLPTVDVGSLSSLSPSATLCWFMGSCLPPAPHPALLKGTHEKSGHSACVPHSGMAVPLTAGVPGLTEEAYHKYGGDEDREEGDRMGSGSCCICLMSPLSRKKVRLSNGLGFVGKQPQGPSPPILLGKALCFALCSALSSCLELLNSF